MAINLIVKLNDDGLLGDTPEEVLRALRADKETWFPLGDGRLSFDEAGLRIDPTDNSFVMFEVVGIEGATPEENKELVQISKWKNNS
jgi:hypothetical protein